jgi:hypothetical protein
VHSAENEGELDRTNGTHGGKRYAYRFLMVDPEGRKQLRRPRRRWENNIKINLREIGWSVMDWINLAIEINGGCCEHDNEHSSSTKC